MSLRVERAAGSLRAMTMTLEEIHRDPAILDRAISRREPLDILAGGEITATLLPKVALSVEDARRVMQARFAAPDWEFTVGAPFSRDEPTRYPKIEVAAAPKG